MSSKTSSTKQESFLPTAGTVSVTVIHDPSKSYGLRLSQQRRSDSNTNKSKSYFDFHNDSDCYDNENDDVDVVIDMIANIHCNGMLKDSPLKEGDILRTINNRRAIHFLGCGDSNNAKGFCSYIKSGSFRDGESVTLVAERPPQTENHNISDNKTRSDSAVVRAFYRKSININGSSDNKKRGDKAISVGVEFRRVVVRDEEEAERIRKKGNGANDTGTSDSDNDDESSHCSDTSTNSSNSSSFLQINRIDPNGMFAHSELNQGDIVLAINGYSVCADENLTVEEANELLGIHPGSETPPLSPIDRGSDFGVSVYETVDILALNPRKLFEIRRHQYKSSRPTLWGRRNSARKQLMQQRAKKAGVAVGGGTMLGAGLVIHPFGPLLMAGGMSVLGTEFELPRKIACNTRDSFEKWAEKEELSTGCRNISPQNHANPLSTERGGNGSSRSNGQHSDVEVRNSNNSIQSRPPPQSMTNRMKGLGRRYVLPFLDKMAGDRRNTRIEPTSSFDIHDSNNNNNSNKHREATTNQYRKEAIIETQELKPRQHELQGRDDDFSHMYDSPLEYDHEEIVTLERIP